MKTGTRVTYVDSKGGEHPATVTEVGERGPSGSRVVSLELDDGGTKSEVPHAADGKGTRTYWTEAASTGGGLTEGQQAAAALAEQAPPKTRGADYVYGEGEPEPGPGDATTQDGPGLGGGGGKDPGNPPPPPPPDPETESTAGDAQAGADSESRSARRK